MIISYHMCLLFIINLIPSTVLCWNFMTIGSELLELHTFKIRRVARDTMYDYVLVFNWVSQHLRQCWNSASDRYFCASYGRNRANNCFVIIVNNKLKMTTISPANIKLHRKKRWECLDHKFYQYLHTKNIRTKVTAAMIFELGVHRTSVGGQWFFIVWPGWPDRTLISCYSEMLGSWWNRKYY